MDIEYNDICKKMEAKGYEYIQEIRAYCEDYTSETGRIFGMRRDFALFGKQLGNITVLRVCGTKYEYEITKANRVESIFLLTSYQPTQHDENEYYHYEQQSETCRTRSPPH